MPKIADYPTASIKKSFELAKAVDELGGNSSIEMCAEKLNKKVSGGFRHIIHSAAKFGFITHRKGDLAVTQLYKSIKLAYNEEEKTKLLQRAFLSIPLFQKVCERFGGQKLPTEVFEKMLIREFHVGDHIASRVMKYFLEGSKTVGLLDSDNIVIVSSKTLDNPTNENSETQSDNIESETTTSEKQGSLLPSGSYSIRISGPGMNSAISITEVEDFEIVETILNKIRRKLESGELKE